MEIMEVTSTAVTAKYSDEEIYFLRFMNLLSSHCPKAVRFWFNGEIHPSQLGRELNKHYTTLNGLKEKRVITLDQWKLLFPPGKEDPSSEMYDTTLMITLLRHLVQIKIEDGLPSLGAGPMTDADALSIIKYYRNQMAHSDTGRLSVDNFNAQFDNVIEAIGKLCPSMKSSCEKLKTEMTPSLIEILQSNILSTKQLNPDFDEIQLTTWRENDALYAEPAVFNGIYDTVKNKHALLITGVPGIGKTFKKMKYK